MDEIPRMKWDSAQRARLQLLGRGTRQSGGCGVTLPTINEPRITFWLIAKSLHNDHCLSVIMVACSYQ